MDEVGGVFVIEGGDVVFEVNLTYEGVDVVKRIEIVYVYV